MLISYERMCALFFEMGSGLQDNKNPIYEISKKDGFITLPGMTLTKKIGWIKLILFQVYLLKFKLSDQINIKKQKRKDEIVP